MHACLQNVKLDVGQNQNPYYNRLRYLSCDKDQLEEDGSNALYSFDTQGTLCGQEAVRRAYIQ